MNLEELKYDLCPGCGERSPKGQGLFAEILHACPLNIITYRATGRFTIRHFQDLMAVMSGTGRESMASFKELLVFPYLKAMSNYDTATDIERKWYYWIREGEVKHMKRLRAHIELEEDLNAKY